MAAAIDMAGRTFDRLLVLRRAETARSKTTGIRWVCQCSCPARTLVTTSGKDLRRGRTRSCGCYRNELGAARYARLTAPAEPDSYRCQWCNTDQPAAQMGPVLFAIEEGGSGMQCRDDRACTKRQKGRNR